MSITRETIREKFKRDLLELAGLSGLPPRADPEIIPVALTAHHTSGRMTFDGDPCATLAVKASTTLIIEDGAIRDACLDPDHYDGGIKIRVQYLDDKYALVDREYEFKATKETAEVISNTLNSVFEEYRVTSSASKLDNIRGLVKELGTMNLAAIEIERT